MVTTKERREENNKRIEARRIEAINEYQRTCLFKFIGYILCVALCSIIVLALLAFLTFQVWNYFNPTQDYLYFIVIYLIIDGLFLSMLVIGIAGEIIKKHVKKMRFEMKMHERKINRYFYYYKKDLNNNDEEDVDYIDLDKE